MINDLAERSWSVSSFGWLQRANNALNHDFCPTANRWVYWLKSPFWCLVLAMALSIICGTFLKTEAFVLTGILSLVVVIGVLFPWFTMKGVDAHVAFDIRRSRVGQPVIVRLRVRNRWPWPVWGVSVVRGFAWKDTAETSEGVSLARIPGWSTTEFAWQFIPQRRGLYPLAAPEIETGFPFGLCRATRRATVDGHVIVWPQIVDLRGVPDSSDMHHADNRLADRRVGEFGDLLGTRPFRNGDSLRRVHWAQTARQQSLIVCERQAPALSAVRVILDLDTANHPGSSAQSATGGIPGIPVASVERCIQAAASICESLHRQHSAVELVLGDQLFVIGESAAGLNRAMDALAMADTVDRQSSSKGARCRTGAFSILITTAEGRLRNPARAGNQHQLVISELDPDTTDDAECSSWLKVYGSDAISAQLPRKWKAACNAG